MQLDLEKGKLLKKNTRTEWKMKEILFYCKYKGETMEISKGFPLMKQYDDFRRGPLEFNLIPIDGGC